MTEKATAGTIPTRSPSSPITAACTAPASPAVAASDTATAVPLDTGRSYTLRRVHGCTTGTGFILSP